MSRPLRGIAAAVATDRTAQISQKSKENPSVCHFYVECTACSRQSIIARRRLSILYLPLPHCPSLFPSHVRSCSALLSHSIYLAFSLSISLSPSRFLCTFYFITLFIALFLSRFVSYELSCSFLVLLLPIQLLYFSTNSCYLA